MFSSPGEEKEIQAYLPVHVPSELNSVVKDGWHRIITVIVKYIQKRHSDRHTAMYM